jgi:hypothetical protein
LLTGGNLIPVTDDIDPKAKGQTLVKLEPRKKVSRWPGVKCESELA